MLLKCFRVKNFKNFAKEFVFNFTRTKDYSFNEACLKNGLIKDAIIYGRNAVGKTNFGLAMFDITYHLVDKQLLPPRCRIISMPTARREKPRFSMNLSPVRIRSFMITERQVRRSFRMSVCR